MGLLAQPARATHIPTNLDVSAKRTEMQGEGYLQYLSNPASRWGNEWTGWVDAKHPSLVGMRDPSFGYDRSDRQFKVTTENSS